MRFTRSISSLCLLFALTASQGYADDGSKLRPYDVEKYRLSFTLDPATTTDRFQGEVDIRFKATDRINDMVLDATELEPISAQLILPTQRDLTIKPEGETFRVTFPGAMRKNDRWTIRIVYRGKVQTAHQGLFRVVRTDTGAPVLATQLEAQHARRLFPCQDHPSDKALSEIEISAPKEFTSIANGVLKSTVPDKTRQGWTKATWSMDKQHSPYLVALAVGVFEKTTRTVGGRELALWTTPGTGKRGTLALDAAQKSMAFFERELGVTYPWNRYGIVGIPTFMWGGMENTTSTHQNEERTLVNDERSTAERRNIVDLTAHELAHQWFGDYATLKWWDDVWLNEAFASLLATDATKDFFHTDEVELRATAELWDRYFRQEEGPRSRPLVAKNLTSVDEAFDSISYTKGEFVLRTLRTFVGKAKFQAGLGGYLKAHALGNATYMDFFAAVEKASGQKLDTFRDSWLLQRGYPIVKYSWKWDEAKKETTVVIDQRPLHADAKLPFRFRLPLTAHRKGAPAFEVRRTVDITAARTEMKFPSAAEPEWVSLNEGLGTLVKVEVTPQVRLLLPKIATEDPDTFTRLWAAYAMAQEAVEKPGENPTAVRSLGEVIRTDKSPYVRTVLLDLLDANAKRYLPSDLGDAVRDEALVWSEPTWEKRKEVAGDVHGWTAFRTQLLRSLGKVDDSSVVAMLEKELGRPDAALDDVAASAIGIARQAGRATAERLDAALARHSGRGYRYRYSILVAFGAFEDPAAVQRIRTLAANATPDWFNGIGRYVKDNHSVRGSREWAGFLEDFLKNDVRVGDEVKARLLSTVEEERAEPVRSMLSSLEKSAPSERLRDLAKRMREKLAAKPRKVAEDADNG